MKITEQNFLPGFKKVVTNDKETLDSFRDILNNSSLTDINKKDIQYITEYFQKHHDPEISSRSFIFYGPPGVGKTYLAEKILQTLNVEILYFANYTLPFGQAILCKNTADLLQRAKNARPQAIFIDDATIIQTSRWSEDPAIVNAADRFIKILELVKHNPKKLLLITTNDIDELDDQTIDRIEVKIRFDLPSTEHKFRYLTNEYRGHLSKQMRTYASQNSIGYNYRDLPELIKLSYRMGEGRVTMSSLKKALKMYHPTPLYGLDVVNAVDTTLKNIIGKPQAITIINRVVQEYKNETLRNRIGLKRGNLLLFHGPPGTGKSFMARALAGEIGFPLINIQMRNLFPHCESPFETIEKILSMAKRYRNCVIFIDEADKFLGREYSEQPDTHILGELHRCIDGVDAQEVQSIFILAVNDASRFGQTLLDRFTLVPFVLPSFDERLVYFQGKIKQVQRQMKCSFQCHDLAARTDKMSYRDMDRLWNDLMFSYLENPKRDITEIISNVSKMFEMENHKEIMFG